MRKKLTLVLVASIACVGCKKTTKEDVKISKDLKPIAVSITVENNTSSTVSIR
jgi:uncharacterized protein YcfL